MDDSMTIVIVCPQIKTRREHKEVIVSFGVGSCSKHMPEGGQYGQGSVLRNEK